MNFWIENERQRNWLLRFAKKNNFKVTENVKAYKLPFGVILSSEEHEICESYSMITENFISLRKLIKIMAKNNKVVFCDNNEVAGPFEKADDFQIGDEVRLVAPGQIYTTYADWFVKNNIPLNIATHYCYMDGGDSYKEKVGTIVACAPHTQGSSQMLYCIQFDSGWDGKPVFLVNDEAIELEEVGE